MILIEMNIRPIELQNMYPTKILTELNIHPTNGYKWTTTACKSLFEVPGLPNLMAGSLKAKKCISPWIDLLLDILTKARMLRLHRTQSCHPECTGCSHRCPLGSPGISSNASRSPLRRQRSTFERTGRPAWRPSCHVIVWKFCFGGGA